MTDTESPVRSSPDYPASNAPSYTHRQILIIMSGVGVGLLLASLDQTIVSTALTRISRDFHRVDLYGWVVTAYLLTQTATTPLYGKLSDQFGRKRMFQIAIVIFLLGSVISGLSQNMYELIAFRAVQGLGGGGLLTLSFAIMGDVIAPRDRGRYQGYFGGVFAISSVLGPLIGGLLVDHASWRWVFYVNVPLGAAGLILVNRTLVMDHAPRRAKVDVLGSTLVVGGVSLLLIGVQLASAASRLTATSWAYIGPGLVLLVAFIWWESRAAEPVIPLYLFRNRIFAVVSTLSLINGSVMFGALLFLPLYYQTVRGVSPTEAGFRLLPLLAGVLITSINVGRAVSRRGRYRLFVNIGTAVMAVGVALTSTITVSTGAWTLSGMLFVIGVGLGFFNQILITAIQNAVPQGYIGVASAAVTFFRTLGGAIGAAVLGAILLLRERSSLPGYQRRYGPGIEAAHHAFVYGLHQAFLWSVPLAVAGFGLSFLLQEVRLRTSSDAGLEAAAEPSAA